MEEIYKKIKQRRTELGMSQEVLASKVGYTSRSTIARIEKGEIDLPRSKVIEIAQALKVTAAYLMGWEEEEALNHYQEKVIELMSEMNEEGQAKMLEHARLLMASGEYKKRDSAVVGEN